MPALKNVKLEKGRRRSTLGEVESPLHSRSGLVEPSAGESSRASPESSLEVCSTIVAVRASMESGNADCSAVTTPASPCPDLGTSRGRDESRKIPGDIIRGLVLWLFRAKAGHGHTVLVQVCRGCLGG